MIKIKSVKGTKIAFLNVSETPWYPELENPRSQTESKFKVSRPKKSVNMVKTPVFWLRIQKPQF